MRIVVFCATQRGYRFLERIFRLAAGNEFVVFSFREEVWEPPFLEDIRQLTLAHGQHFFEARQIGSARWEAFWQTTSVDIIFAISWRYLIPAHVYMRSHRGAFIFHDSLLPRYRGFAPTVWAILNGEQQTGVTLFQMVEAVDAGDIIDQQAVTIAPNDYIAHVLEHVTETYLLLLERNIDMLLHGTIVATPQNEAEATYTCKRLPEDNLIDWTKSSVRIYNLIRAVSHPYPGAFTYFQGQKVFVWAAQYIERRRQYVGQVPGRVVEVKKGTGAVVLTGDGEVLITQVQAEGHLPMQADELFHSLSHTLGKQETK